MFPSSSGRSHCFRCGLDRRLITISFVFLPIRWLHSDDTKGGITQKKQGLLIALKWSLCWALWRLWQFERAVKTRGLIILCNVRLLPDGQGAAILPFSCVASWLDFYSVDHYLAIKLALHFCLLSAKQKMHISSHDRIISQW